MSNAFHLSPKERLALAAEGLAQATAATVDQAVAAAWEILEETQFAVLDRCARDHCKRLYHRMERCRGGRSTACDGAFEAARFSLVKRAIGKPLDPDTKEAARVEQAQNSWLARWWTRQSQHGAPVEDWDDFARVLAGNSKSAAARAEAQREWNGERGLPQKFVMTKTLNAQGPQAYQGLLQRTGMTSSAAAVGLTDPLPIGRRSVDPVEVWLEALYLDACQTASEPIDHDRVARRLVDRVRGRDARDWPGGGPPADLEALMLDLVVGLARAVEEAMAEIDDWVEVLGRARDHTRPKQSHQDHLEGDDDPEPEWADVSVGGTETTRSDDE